MYYFEEKPISKAVIRRLPRYYRYLNELLEQGVDRISSKDLSRLMNVTASQIRQDLNNFGEFGQQGYGYNIKNLHTEIGKLLGVDHPYNVIIIGAGNLGRALVNYKGFADHGFVFCGMFDRKEELKGTLVGNVEVHTMADLPDFLTENDVSIAAITIPREAAGEVTKKLYDEGMRYFWNFAHTDLHLPDDAIVKNVHLLDSLLELSYEINSNDKL